MITIEEMKAVALEQRAQVVMTSSAGSAGRACGSTRPVGLLAVLKSTEFGLGLAILVILGLIYWLEPTHSFFGAYSLQTLFHNSALFGVLAVGAAVVIIAGGIDLSVGSVVALSGVIGARLLTEWLPGAHTSSDPLPLSTVALGDLSDLDGGPGRGAAARAC